MTEIEDFNEEFGTNFSGDEFDTIGGLVTHTFGHLPTRGEKATLGHLNFVTQTQIVDESVFLKFVRMDLTNPFKYILALVAGA